ncbi:MAG: tetratricopeptide repeat protein [Kofleriaceae bacterium]
MRPAGRSLRVLAALTVAVSLVAGCDGLNARRAVREGNDEFKAGRYEQAIKAFEQAIELEPTLDIAHHNLGLAYYKLTSGTVDDDKLKEFADKAAIHLGEYLKANPKDSVVRNKMTQIWIDSGNYDKALTYWEDQLKAEPQNQEIMGVLAGINLKADRWRQSLEWLDRSLAASQTPENKRSLYVQIARRCRQVILNRGKIFGQERIDVSNVCIPQVLAGLAGDPKNLELLGVINQIFAVRALSQGASFAAFIDKASGQDHEQLRRVLVDEAKKAKAAEQAANPDPNQPPATDGSGAAPTAPAAGATGSGADGSGAAADADSDDGDGG